MCIEFGNGILPCLNQKQMKWYMEYVASGKCFDCFMQIRVITLEDLSSQFTDALRFEGEEPTFQRSRGIIHSFF